MAPMRGDGDDDLTVAEVAEILHWRPSEVLDRVARGDLPPTRFRNGKYRIQKSALMTAIVADSERRNILRYLEKEKQVKTPDDRFLERLKAASPQEREAMTSDLVANFLGGYYRQSMPGLNVAQREWERAKGASGSSTIDKAEAEFRQKHNIPEGRRGQLRYKEDEDEDRKEDEAEDEDEDRRLLTFKRVLSDSFKELGCDEKTAEAIANDAIKALRRARRGGGR